MMVATTSLFAGLLFIGTIGAMTMATAAAGIIMKKELMTDYGQLKFASIDPKTLFPAQQQDREHRFEQNSSYH